MSAALLVFALVGCVADTTPGWSLVGAYDLAAIRSLEAEATDWTWSPPPGMRESCGPAKAPDGLGVMEAEAVAAGLTPSLALILERVSDVDGASTPDNLQVALGVDGQPSALLHPAVEPRSLAIRIEGDASDNERQLVRTQLQIELCLEHKTGRGWIGGQEDEIREALLLERPAQARPDRKYYGGQEAPVPALLGPPDACLVGDQEAPSGGRGEGSLDLVPSDVWGATLRRCSVEEAAGQAAGFGRRLPLYLEGSLVSESATPTAWDALEIALEPGGEAWSTRVSMQWNGETLLEDAPLFPAPRFAADESPSALMDLVARVPYRYPTLGPPGDRGRYTVLIIPNWQLVEAMVRLQLVAPLYTRSTSARGEVIDGVGYLLEHPELLYVQVPRDGDSDDESWLNLARAVGGAGMGLREWGYTLGVSNARKPVVMPGAAPSWRQSSAAHRALFQTLSLLSAAVCLPLLIGGLLRLRELWVRVPEERADYWPGAGEDDS